MSRILRRLKLAIHSTRAKRAANDEWADKIHDKIGGPFGSIVKRTGKWATAVGNANEIRAKYQEYKKKKII